MDHRQPEGSESHEDYKSSRKNSDYLPEEDWQLQDKQNAGEYYAGRYGAQELHVYIVN